jgi:glycosyltransferase involved in cell wall biosynthesis
MRPSAVSVIIAARNAASHVEKCLAHLACCDAHECIVVDDASTDQSWEVAQRAGIRVIRLNEHVGPARARNLGARAATGDILFFVDADVCVPQDSISRITQTFASDPELTAVIGSYDDSPDSLGFLSQYRNLLHCFTHQSSRENACTFWTGCGAIRKQTFIEFGGFDESYLRPCVEDIELGSRLVRAGKKIRLDKSLQVKHLKDWTLSNILRTDIFDRGIPWTELTMRDRWMPDDLNLTIGSRISVIFSWLCLGLFVLNTALYRAQFVIPCGCLVLLAEARICVDAPNFRRVLLLSTGVILTCLAVSRYWHALWATALVLLPAYVLLFLRLRFVYSNERLRRMSGIGCGVYLLGAALIAARHLPFQLPVVANLVCLAVVVSYNSRFYAFIGSRLGRMYAPAVILIHFMYHCCNGVSFVMGNLAYWRKTMVRQHAVPVGPGVPTETAKSKGVGASGA